MMFNRKPSAESSVNCPDVKKIENHKPPIEPIIRNYRLITPLMGGGVKAGENDSNFLIRPSSIRGQLRFWWRACFGGSHQPQSHDALLADMFARESALFGKAADSQSSGASAVQVEIEVINSGSQFRVIAKNGQEVKISAMNSPYGYSAFPLQDKQNASVREGIEFKLTIHLKSAEQREELEKVLWAWQTFGGIGARTRRGFGVLQALDKANHRFAFANKAELQQHIRAIIGNRSYWPNGVPHLAPTMQLRLIKPKPNQTALNIWADLLRCYKEFRQQRNDGNQPNRPGRSRWPEPDALRRLTRQRSRLHEQPLSTIDAFPRGEFGLPIIFHFKDSDDPGDSELRLQANHEFSQQKGDRFASPMLLKPVASTGQLFGLIAVFEGSTLDGRQAIIKNRRITAAAVIIDVSESQARTIVDKQRRPMLTNPSIITSFLETIEE
ncbi:MAG TPA: type III-B CRISPR module RAMP protein Cmr1 [Herpetosiphon sp.]|uniref:CRISPR-associated RAMP protein, Cmr1 family n=1 Tax=Herpetosiphon aurantiacus (strain ATCC 23779 / DSM 785 / 114-95) TaxID=316274 RepID=A9AVY7_HERA2|nr:type III-B CRISPR module RAMP protein Cmr1 [Herpetosiphon sp.]ABX03225.1 CRISPR-associated RAMP protein, Cmr1 family [Herpetosiphon aurantiacus DSM 785]HBW52520.1 type III-B CRISPR module RAMP protein Cmr1 [Herpetosiphon sp.]